MNNKSHVDMYIFAVHYNNDRQIEEVKVVTSLEELSVMHFIDAESDEYGERRSREEIATFINNQALILTVLYNEAITEWLEGSEVNLYGDDFIRTNPDETLEDNLGEIIEY